MRLPELDAQQEVMGGYQLGHVLIAVAATACVMFVLYWLWTWPCGDKEAQGNGNVRKYDRLLPEQSVKPLYALELEPGLVVLQSEDGEFFRILREYDTADRRGYGSTSGDVPGSVSENHHYIPSYTRPHFQTKHSTRGGNDRTSRSSDLGRPTTSASAPSADLNSERFRPDPFHDGASWAPITTLGKEF